MRVYKSTPLQYSSFLAGPKKYQIRRFQGISERDKDLSTEETLDPKLIRMMKESSEVVFARSNTDTPLLDFAGKKPENFTDILDFRLGKYYSYFVCKLYLSIIQIECYNSENILQNSLAERLLLLRIMKKMGFSSP